MEIAVGSVSSDFDGVLWLLQ